MAETDTFMALVGPTNLEQLQQAFSDMCQLSVVFTDLDLKPLLPEDAPGPLRMSVPIESNGQTIARLAFGQSDLPPRVMRAVAATLQTIANLIAQQAAIAHQNKILSQQMVHLSIGVTQAHEEERHRIARELHDEVTQALSSIGLGLDLVMVDLGAEHAVYPALAQIQSQSTELTRQIRRISQDLRPPALDSFGLVPSLRQYIKRFGEQKHAPQVFFQVDGEIYRQPPDIELAVFRVVQEAMNNCQKHARAQHITVTLTFEEEGLDLVVADDGRGFEVGDALSLSMLASEGHLGLIGMQERMAAVGGQWRVESAPKQGCRVIAHCPRVAEAHF